MREINTDVTAGLNLLASRGPQMRSDTEYMSTVHVSPRSKEFSKMIFADNSDDRCSLKSLLILLSAVCIVYRAMRLLAWPSLTERIDSVPLLRTNFKLWSHFFFFFSDFFLYISLRMFVIRSTSSLQLFIFTVWNFFDRLSRVLAPPTDSFWQCSNFSRYSHCKTSWSR